MNTAKWNACNVGNAILHFTSAQRKTNLGSSSICTNVHILCLAHLSIPSISNRRIDKPRQA